MKTLTRINQGFAVEIGRSAPDVVLPAMPIRILYIGPERDYSLATKSGNHFFRMQIPKEFTPGWDLNAPWDAYKLREAFENLRNPEDAWNWLNVEAKRCVNLARATRLARNTPPTSAERFIGMVPDDGAAMAEFEIRLSAGRVYC